MVTVPSVPVYSILLAVRDSSRDRLRLKISLITFE